MTKLRSVTAGALATAMLATSFTPALAQGYRGGYPGVDYGRSDYCHRGDDDTGAIVAGVIGVSILAAITSSASSSANHAPNLGYAGNGYSGSIRSDEAAADGCANAAEPQIRGGARVSSVDAVDRVADGFNVRGIIDYARGGDTRYSGSRDQRSFNCAVRYGNIQRVHFVGYSSNY